MKLKTWWKLTFEIEKNLEDLIIWKLSEFEISSVAFNHIQNRPDLFKVEVWLLNSKSGQFLKKNLNNLFKKFLAEYSHQSTNINWSLVKDDWVESWKNYWKPCDIGKNFIVLPSWIELPDNSQSKNVIKIDPGAAFGTGSHPSTYLCLREMEDIKIKSKKVLDIGCGSGILLIAAKILGATNLHAIDNDYLAINSTEQNFKLNFKELKGLNLYEGYFQEITLNKSFKDFDLITCNILANVIKLIIPDIFNSLKFGGQVILSGILSSQKEDIIKLLNLNHFSIDNVLSEKDWICIRAKKIR